MQAEIIFSTEGEDFHFNGVSEVFRIMREINEALMRGEEAGTIYNSDYENIGHWRISLPLK